MVSLLLHLLMLMLLLCLFLLCSTSHIWNPAY